MQGHGGEAEWNEARAQISWSIKGVGGCWGGCWGGAGRQQMRQKMKWQRQEEGDVDGLCLLHRLQKSAHCCISNGELLNGFKQTNDKASDGLMKTIQEAAWRTGVECVWLSGR